MKLKGSFKPLMVKGPFLFAFFNSTLLPNSFYHKLILIFTLFASFANFNRVFAQDDRIQFPSALANSYFEINLGYIHYPFSSASLEPGYTVEEVHIPRAAPRIVLYGHEFTDYISAQISYTRPVFWVRYRNIDGTNNYKDSSNHPVFMNIGGLTIKGTLPIGSKFSLYGEGGLAVITRTGFHEKDDEDRPDIVKDANYASFLLGAGLNYHLNDKWALKLSAIYSPGHLKSKQPYTAHIAGGFAYTMRELSEEKLAKKLNSEYVFPVHLIQLGYATNAFGYGVNDFFSEGTVPVFWGGNAHVAQGLSIQYQRNVFHGKKIFSLDWGATFGYWQTQLMDQDFVTLAVFPLFRFTLLRTKPADFYFNYSLAGPSYISRLNISGRETGPHFTFQDYMGIGGFIGKERNLNFETRIGHYSNGNIFPENEGVKIPLTFNLGYTF